MGLHTLSLPAPLFARPFALQPPASQSAQADLAAFGRLPVAVTPGLIRGALIIEIEWNEPPGKPHLVTSRGELHAVNPTA
jgi:hypothetical protein